MTLIFGYLTWKFVEKPWRDTNVISKTQIFTYSLICTLILLVFGLLGYVNEGYPSRFTPELLKLSNTRNHEALLINSGCNLENGKFNVETCVKGNKKIPPNFALIGDSHGQAIAHELEESFKKNDISYIPFVSSGCPLNFYMEEAKIHDLQKCALYQRAIKNELIARDDIRTLILISRRDDPSFDKRNPDEKVIKAFGSNIRSIKEILNLGKRVILIYPTPVHEIMVTNFMTKNTLFNNGRLESVSSDSIKFRKRIKYFYDGYDSIGLQSNLVRIKTDLIFCDSFEKLKCVYQVNGVPLYYDKGHLSNDGARLIVNEIMKYIKN